MKERELLEKMLETSKLKFFEKLKKKSVDARNSKAYFYAINMLGGKDAPKIWNVRTMYPDSSDIEMAEDLATFFNKISCKFEPLYCPGSQILNATRISPQAFEIAARLKKIRKPNSTVKGDIPPSLICPRVADLLAIPLALVYE